MSGGEVMGIRGKVFIFNYLYGFIIVNMLICSRKE